MAGGATAAASAKRRDFPAITAVLLESATNRTSAVETDIFWPMLALASANDKMNHLYPALGHCLPTVSRLHNQT
jgi:hypothetical protein